MDDTHAQQDEMSFLLSITGDMAKICAASLKDLRLADSDLSIAALVIKYAQEIDKGGLQNLAKFGPLILQAMEALQMSPRSRALAAKGNNSNGTTPSKPRSALDELRLKRDQRKNGTPDIHAPSTGTDS